MKLSQPECHIIQIRARYLNNDYIFLSPFVYSPDHLYAAIQSISSIFGTHNLGIKSHMSFEAEVSKLFHTGDLQYSGKIINLLFDIQTVFSKIQTIGDENQLLVSQSIQPQVHLGWVVIRYLYHYCDGLWHMAISGTSIQAWYNERFAPWSTI